MTTPPHPTAPARGELACNGCGDRVEHGLIQPGMAHQCGGTYQPTPTGTGEAVDLSDVERRRLREHADYCFTAFGYDGVHGDAGRAINGALRYVTHLESALHSAREEAGRLGREAVKLWQCPDCAFAFDAMHEDEGGGYSCPLCAEQRLERELAETKAARDAWEEEYHRNTNRLITERREVEDALAARDAELAGVREALANERARRERAEKIAEDAAITLALGIEGRMDRDAAYGAAFADLYGYCFGPSEVTRILAEGRRND